MEWSPEYFKEHLPEKSVFFSKQSEDPWFSWACCPIKGLLRDDFFNAVTKPDSKLNTYFAGPLRAVGPLQKDVDTSLLEVKEVETHEATAADGEGEGQGEGATTPKSQSTLWIGTAGATTPLHYDGMHNFFVQLHGSKRFSLASPSEWDKVYLYPKFHLKDRNAMVNISNPDLDTYPRFADAVIAEVVVTRGDVLYVPPMWFHQVTALETAVSVNVWSPSKYLDRIDTAWELEVPIRMEEYTVRHALGAVAAYIWTLTRTVLGPKAMDILHTAVETRYHSLYSKDGTGPYPDGQYEPSSPEGRQYQEYLAELENTPNFIDTAPVDESGRPVEVQPDENAHDTWAIKLGKQGRMKASPDNPPNGDYERYRNDYTQHCVEQDVLDWVFGTTQNEYDEAAEAVASVLNQSGAPRGVMEIQFLNYLEDLVSQLVGEEQVYSYLKSCVLSDRGF